MIARRLWGSVALLACTTSCMDLDAMKASRGSSASTPADESEPSSAAAAQKPSAQNSSDCESSSADTGSWPAALGDEDPFEDVRVRVNGLCEVFAASAHTGVRKLDAAGGTDWVRPFGSIVDVTLDGTVYAAGSFSG